MTSHEAGVVEKVEEMLATLNVKRRVRTIQDIDSGVFVTLFEGLCGESLKDVIPNPRSREDEAHNVQAVIDSLSMDILNISLSHISGQDVINCNVNSVNNLVEVLYGLMEFMLEEISCHSSSAAGDHMNGSSACVRVEDVLNTSYRAGLADTSLSAHQPTRSAEMQRDFDISRRNSNLGHSGVHSGLIPQQQQPSRDNTDTTATDGTRDLIALGDSDYLKSTELPSHGSNNVQQQHQQPTQPGPKDVDARYLEPNYSDHQYGIIQTDIRPMYTNNNYITASRELTETRMPRSATLPHNGYAPYSGTTGVRPLSSSTGDLQRSGLLQQAASLDRGRTTEDDREGGRDEDWEGGRDEDRGGYEGKAAGLSTSRQDRFAKVKAWDTQGGDEVRRRLVEDDRGQRRHEHELTKSNHRPANFSRSAPVSSISRSMADEVLPPRQSHSLTYPDYLRKYYGETARVRAPSSGLKSQSSRTTGSPRREDNEKEEREAAYLSDGCVNYSSPSTYSKPDRSNSELAAESSSFQRELSRCKRELEKKAKAVRFDDYLDGAATGRMGGLRRKFRNEERNTRIRKEYLNKVYKDGLTELEHVRDMEKKEAVKLAKEKERTYRKLLGKKPITSTQNRLSKYSVPTTSVLLPRSRLSRRPVGAGKDRKRSASASPFRRSVPSLPGDDNDILPWLLEEFPYLQLTPTTLQTICRRGAQQLEYLSREETFAHRQKSKLQQQIEEAERRQKILLDIMEKEHGQKQRLCEARERQKTELSVRGKLRDKRLQSARVRKYYSEYQVRQRSKMLKKKTKEELVFKRLFTDGLNIQKEKMRDLRNYAKEQREEKAKKQQQELESIENYYKTQFDMLAESLHNERTESSTRDKAQTKVLEEMKRTLRKKMEKEISDLQERLWRDDDDLYFRELDAERVRIDLNLTRYQARL